MRPRLTLLRSAVVAAAAGGALLVPAAAFADSPAAPATATAGADAGQVRERPAAQAPDEATVNPFFLAAGGTMAAAGAAGLVYSTVRRGRADA
ncbi:hypothetical protein [Streptomyces sp. NPDC052225]|uniref:hypothetical protein n=1 Tax=Streptomyces sp. NPDC052225 TaxID=3154949 RepID=UPI00341DC17F